MIELHTTGCNYRGGYFRELESNLLLKNGLTATGAGFFLRDLFRKETTLIADELYLGMTNADYTFDNASLATMAAGEPVANGYERQLLNRDTTDWTVQEVNGVMQALSKIVTFTCTTAPWTINWTKMFICDAADGTSGTVLSVSGPAPAARVVGVGQGPSVRYEYYLRGGE